jgi:hypothetical protein
MITMSSNCEKKNGLDTSGKRKRKEVRYHWLSPIILSAQESKMRRIAIESLSRLIIHEAIS